MTDRIQVLYVDDDLDMLNIGKIFLERQRKFSITTTPGAPQAIRLLKEQSFDVIISDYQMPEMDGLTFLKHLKGEGNTTPFILFNGTGPEGVVIEALKYGADYSLQKGGDPKALFADLSDKILEIASRRRDDRE